MRCESADSDLIRSAFRPDPIADPTGFEQRTSVPTHSISLACGRKRRAGNRLGPRATVHAKYRKALRSHSNFGCTRRQMASWHMSPSTVGGCIECATEAGLTWADDEAKKEAPLRTVP